MGPRTVWVVRKFRGAEKHDHGQNLIETRRINLVPKSFILSSARGSNEAQHANPATAPARLMKNRRTFSGSGSG